MIISDDSSFFCHFVKINNHYECSKCGNKVSILDNMEDDPPFWPCSSPLKSENVSAQQIRNFMSNTLSDNGLEDLSIIEQRYAICKSCEFFQNNSCNKCGCDITKDRNYLNKLASKNESCPISKW